MARTSLTASSLARALASNTLCSRIAPHYDVMDAAAGLEILATGGTLDLDGAGWQRAAQPAAIVRVRAAA